MADVKERVYKALNGIRGAKVFFHYPDTFESLPCVSFYEQGAAPAEFADDEEYAFVFDYVVDVWGGTSVEVSKLAKKVSARMKGLGFVRGLSGDVPDAGSIVRHKTMRFKLLTGDDEN